jgi:hypothetical protein
VKGVLLGGDKKTREGNLVYSGYSPAPQTNSSYEVLALAIVYGAVLDLKSKNPARASEARTWLQLVGLSWCQILGIPDEELERWAANNFAVSPSVHRNWRY